MALKGGYLSSKDTMPFRKPDCIIQVVDISNKNNSEIDTRWWEGKNYRFVLVIQKCHLLGERAP